MMDMNQAVPAIGGLDWGALRSMEPASDRWGFDRGLPIDRHYIERFLARYAQDIRGRCLEVMNANYVRRFGGAAVDSVDVVDINAANPNATVVGDLADPDTLGEGRYDCFVLTQTLPMVYDIHALVRNAWAALRPGGCLLATAPVNCRYSPHPEEYWRLTRAAMARLIAEHAPDADVEVGAHGNLVTNIGFLTGLASGELTPEELAFDDPRFPILVTARARKPPVLA